MKAMNRRNVSGMTLIEVVVAMALLALFTLGAVKLLTVIKRNTDFARQNYQAVNLARDRIERARFVNFASIDLLEEPFPGTRINRYGYADPNGLFQRQTTINDVTNGLKSVKVAVWLLNRKTFRFEREPQVMETYVAKMLKAPEE